jgi:hypothetical protein
MPIKEVTSIRHQQPIFDRLEAARKAGVISEICSDGAAVRPDLLRRSLPGAQRA